MDCPCDLHPSGFLLAGKGLDLTQSSRRITCLSRVILQLPQTVGSGGEGREAEPGYPHHAKAQAWDGAWPPT